MEAWRCALDSRTVWTGFGPIHNNMGLGPFQLGSFANLSDHESFLPSQPPTIVEYILTSSWREVGVVGSGAAQLAIAEWVARCLGSDS